MVKERLHVALAPRQPVGMTPSGLAYDNEQKRLYIACSDANTVAVADVSGKLPLIEGFLPVGWYPTAVTVLPDRSLLVLNGKGVQSLPNPKGPTDSMDRRTLTPQQLREVQEHQPHPRGRHVAHPSS